MKYISSYQDVGPVVQPKQVSYEDLLELAKEVDKKEFFKSDMRLIFALDDSQLTDEALESLNKIINRGFEAQ